MSTRLSHPPDMLYMQYVRIIIHFHGGCYVNRITFQLEVDGLPPDAFAVVSFHLTQSLSSLFSLDLSLVSQQFLSLEFAQVLDKMAYLTIWQGDEYSAG